MRKKYTKTYKIKMVKKYQKSNIKVSDFCKVNEIPISTFNRWLLENKIESQNENTTNFGEIDMEILCNPKTNTENRNSNNEEQNEIKLIMPNVEVCFKSGCSKKILQPLLEAILID